MPQSHAPNEISPIHPSPSLDKSGSAETGHADLLDKHLDSSPPSKEGQAGDNDPHASVHVDEATLFASPLPITGTRRTTTRKELWSWYLYYVGNSGLGPFNFAISAWQNQLYNIGYDPALGPGNACGDGGCFLNAYGQDRDSESVPLVWHVDDTTAPLFAGGPVGPCLQHCRPV